MQNKTSDPGGLKQKSQGENKKCFWVCQEMAEAVEDQFRGGELFLFFSNQFQRLESLEMQDYKKRCSKKL